MTEKTVHAAPTEQDYVPVEDWPAVTTMVAGFGEPSLATSTKLENAPVETTYEDGSVVTYTFGPSTVAVTSTGDSGQDFEAAHYRAVELREGIFFVDWRTGDRVTSVDSTLVLDFHNGRAHRSVSRFVDSNGSVRMHTTVMTGTIAGTPNTGDWCRTNELVGKRIYYRYSPTEHYEHIYLNSGTFTWHCVRGGEAGLADTDPIKVWNIAENLVLLYWSETVMPVESIVAIDLEHERSIGRMFCWDGPTLDAVHIPFDSEFTVLNDTQYPQD
ncbi:MULTISPECIES: MoaF C-terminal domain-containing protein [unclassified Brevibacterium]|uniref:MoaF C-terminal domain-containing protein n=1 Tax=unclassified Brevibacterium TaxID=2614124 RepID=UPI001091D29E|nr:MoaF C-terminal domain-containing protein [Brevibacterium sp. S22]TGD26858.1 hypothetical protein EB835_19380 [Brevibacterium sp. S22]